MLRAYAARCDGRAAFAFYDGLAALPPFNPDADVEPLPPEVARLRRLITDVDAVVISTPEYAHALPGALKNALDWLVSDPAFIGKPVVILHATRGSTWALDSLHEVLRTMSADVRETVALPLGSNTLSEEQILARPELCAVIDSSVAALLARRRTQLA